MMRKLLAFAHAARKSVAILVAVLTLAAGGFSSASYATNNNHHKAGHAHYAKWQPAWWHSIWKRFWKQPVPQYSDPVGSCGYAVRSGTYSIWPGGYQAWVDVKNVEGETATDFEVLIDIGNATLVQGHLAEYEQVEDGYMVSAPFWLQWQQIPQGSRYRFQFIGKPYYDGVTPYVISINGVTCDTQLPEISLAASGSFFYAEDTLTLTAQATDNVAVRKVVFMQDGEVIAEDSEAPYELEIDVTDALNGNHLYTATAYDPTGNEASAGPARVFVSIGNKFFGTAPGGPEDYEHLLTYFNQLTPENAGKWGSVEGERDVMNWDALDTAYYFARENGLPFKYHTLIWGQQQPGWINALPVEEQLAEIDEWMSEIAARYPDLEMVEPVNEPLHAPPSYMEALGGAGETGYDWVITAFEMAREHFPNSQLILNDYQILHLEVFTQDYLGVIGLLQERGLIDAIGVQAHFLERAEVPVVASNLQLLADTGLPIYVSEYDLNYADDARQANVMRDLFTVFWEQPAVAGVTHWGHLQGSVWRTNAYLIRSDGSTRPALDWLVCYLGGGGDSCTVPEYIPAGWQGDEYGVNLEAEEYDTAAGVAALGSVVAYTDAGDWIAFKGVEFQEGWDTFWVTYAKGNVDIGSISVHIDSLENAPVLTVELPPTAGWGTSDRLELPWAALSGTHDVYIRFNDVEGIANLDNLRFGKPRPPSEINLIPDGGFESGVAGWSSWDGTSLSVSTDQAYAGNQSLLAAANGGAQFAVSPNIGLDMTPGVTYAVSAELFNGSTETSPVQLTYKLACGGASDVYTWIASADLAPGAWTEISGELSVPGDCSINEVLVYFENATAGIDIYLDEVKVSPPGENLLADGGFETGISGWSSWDGTSLSASTDQAYEGSQSLLAAANGGAQFAVSPNLGVLMTPGTTYSVSAQVFVGGTEDSPVQMTYKLACDSESDVYSGLGNITAVAGAWTPISGSLTIPDSCSINEVLVYFENATAGIDIHLDAVSVIAN
jgi:GH35 family endo-1,4-beta-xylanase